MIHQSLVNCEIRASGNNAKILIKGVVFSAIDHHGSLLFSLLLFGISRLTFLIFLGRGGVEEERLAAYFTLAFIQSLGRAVFTGIYRVQIREFKGIGIELFYFVGYFLL